MELVSKEKNILIAVLMLFAREGDITPTAASLPHLLEEDNGL